MTEDAPQKRSERKPVTVQDLLRLHRYARSRFMDGFRSKNSLARSEDVKPDAITHSWSRIEAEFGIYVLTRRATGSLSQSDDLHSEGEVMDFLQKDDADRLKKLADEKTSETTTPVLPRPPTTESRHSLTLAGEIFGEVASILAGYLTIAKLATRRKPNGHHVHSSDLLRVLGWLQIERRRLHRAVTDARASDTAVFEIGVQDLEEHFSPAKRAEIDVLDMATCPVEHDPSRYYDLAPDNSAKFDPEFQRVFKPAKAGKVRRMPKGPGIQDDEKPGHPPVEDQATPPPSSRS